MLNRIVERRDKSRLLRVCGLPPVRVSAVHKHFRRYYGEIMWRPSHRVKHVEFLMKLAGLRWVD